MRNNYVLVDLENVQPESLAQLAQEHFKVLVFVGANQTKLPFGLAASLQQMGNRAEYIKFPAAAQTRLIFISRITSACCQHPMQQHAFISSRKMQVSIH